MSIRSISFGDIFSNRKLRFDSQKNGCNINFGEGKKPVDNDLVMIRYGIPDSQRKKFEPNITPPMPKYAPPPEPPQNNTNYIITPEGYKKIKPLKPETYMRYAIPGHFND